MGAKECAAVVVVVVVIGVIALGLGLGLGLGLKKESSESNSEVSGIPSPRPTTSPSAADCTAQGCVNAGVATDAEECSMVGRKILEQHNGNAVDAAIAALICVGVVNLHSTGIGGGGFMLIYNSSTEEVTALDFRETAPKQFDVDSFKQQDKKGLRSIGIPGQVKGLEMAKTNFGNPAVSWETLFTDAKSLAERGIITAAAKIAVRVTCDDLKNELYYDNLRKFLSCDSDGEIATLRQSELAETLGMIAAKGSRAFYNSEWTTELVEELKTIVGENNTDITVEDFKEYEVKERRVIESDFKNYKVYGFGAPASGSIMALLLNVMEELEIQTYDATTLFKIIGALKIVCPEYLKIGDPDDPDTGGSVNMAMDSMITPEAADAVRERIQRVLDENDSLPKSCYEMDGTNSAPALGGTTHLSVVDRMGNAVTVTSSINNYFGNWIYSSKTGVIFNNELDDFGPSEPNSANLPAPSKRPRSAAVPTIIKDRNTNKLKLVIGAAGGQRIPAAVLQTILGVLNFDQSLESAIENARVYVIWNGDLFDVKFEEDKPGFGLYDELKLKEEDVTRVTSNTRSVVQGVNIDGNKKFPFSDKRKKGGKADGYRRRRRHSLNQ